MTPTPFAFHRLGTAVKGLLVSTAIVFAVQQFVPQFLGPWLGLVPNHVWSKLYVWQVVTYLFLHGNFFHFLFNMFALWMFGRELEYAWGSKEFLKFYFICGIGAALTNVVAEPFSTLPVIGASGAIYGILVAFAMVFPETVIYVYGIIPMRARHFVLLLGIIEFLATFHGSSSAISRFAHLGGILTGYLYLKSYQFRSFWHHAFYKIVGSLVIHKPKPDVKSSKQKFLKEEDLAKEVDRILEKVLVHGADSLTEDERAVMRRYSSLKGVHSP
jgi:membrane associated rhomboid family serine protease